MDATLVLIDSDAELLRARALVDQLWNSNDPADVARLEAQARLIAAYEEMKWPRRPPRSVEALRSLDRVAQLFNHLSGDNNSGRVASAAVSVVLLALTLSWKSRMAARVA